MQLGSRLRRTARLQYVSDLHLEHRTDYPRLTPVPGSSLALLGDIGNPFRSNYCEFLRYTSHNWERVFVIAGNHEYWQAKYNLREVNEQIQEITSRFQNVVFLHQSKYRLGNHTIVGATLWSRIKSHVETPQVYKLCIRLEKGPVTTADLNELHREDALWLRRVIQSSSDRLIVLTHHLPSYRLIIDKYKMSPWSQHMDRYATDLEDLIRPPVEAWLCGHSHCVVERLINGVYCAINVHTHKVEVLKWIDLD